jgi:RNA polymerase sigma factor (sigma-70 family)
LDEFTGQPEPAAETEVEMTDEQDDEPINKFELTTNQLSALAQERVAQKLIDMPELDSRSFWQWVEQPGTGQLAGPEALGWAIHEFALQGQLVKAERVFTALYTIFNPRALLLAKRNSYVNNPFDDNVQMAEEVVSLAWQDVYRLLTNKTRSFNWYNFAGYFASIVNTRARDLARKNGFGPTGNPSKSEENENVSDTRQNRKTTDRADLPPQSLDAPLDKNHSLNERNTLGSYLADDRAETAFDMLEFIEKYHEFLDRLTSEERQILHLTRDGLSVSAIARMLKRDWQTIDRRLDSIKGKTDLFDGGDRFRKDRIEKENHPKGAARQPRQNKDK